MRISADTLIWLRTNGRILEEAPVDPPGNVIDARREDEVHDCLICGMRAQAAYIAHTDDGPRWLDLCMRDADRVRRISSGAEVYGDGQS